MSLMDGFTIAFVCLFIINLIVLVAYIGPILAEIKGILADVRSITATSEQRVKKIDQALDKATIALTSMRGLNRLIKFFRSFLFIKRRGEHE